MRKGDFELTLLIDFFTVNSIDIAISFVGAFFGFLFAIISGSIFNKILSYIRKRDILKSLKNELREIKQSLEEDTNHSTYFRYNYSIWKTIESSGGILSLSQMKEYKELIAIYEKIYFADMFEQQYFDIYKFNLVNKTDEIKQSLHIMNEKRKEKKQSIIIKLGEFIKKNE